MQETKLFPLSFYKQFENEHTRFYPNPYKNFWKELGLHGEDFFFTIHEKKYHFYFYYGDDFEFGLHLMNFERFSTKEKKIILPFFNKLFEEMKSYLLTESKYRLKLVLEPNYRIRKKPDFESFEAYRKRQWRYQLIKVWEKVRDACNVKKKMKQKK